LEVCKGRKGTKRERERGRGEQGFKKFSNEEKPRRKGMNHEGWAGRENGGDLGGKRKRLGHCPIKRGGQIKQY